MALALVLLSVALAQDCHYQTWEWSVREKRAVNIRRVTTSREKLTQDERGPYPGCTVCEEDHISISAQGQDTKVCRAYAQKYQQALIELSTAKFPITELEGYRVGKSKGPVNAQGLRTQFSNHSYGVALDVNAGKNGLYDHCLSFSSKCRLLRGGPYWPDRPGSLRLEHSLIFRSFGFKWGGEINGQQKDFMHFSPSGD